MTAHDLSNSTSWAVIALMAAPYSLMLRALPLSFDIYPNSGKTLAMNATTRHDNPVMQSERGSGASFEDLLEHLERHFGLRRQEAARVVQEVLAYFNEPVEAFVKRRHGELQREGVANPEIFRRIADELRWWLQWSVVCRRTVFHSYIYDSTERRNAFRYGIGNR